MEQNELNNVANDYIKKSNEMQEQKKERAKKRYEEIENAVNDYVNEHNIKTQYKSLFIAKVRAYIIGCCIMKDIERELSYYQATKELTQMHRNLTNSLNKSINEIIKFIDKYSEDIKA